MTAQPTSISSVFWDKPLDVIMDSQMIVRVREKIRIPAHGAIGDEAGSKDFYDQGGDNKIRLVIYNRYGQVSLL
jgi:hypothetical protein